MWACVADEGSGPERPCVGLGREAGRGSAPQSVVGRSTAGARQGGSEGVEGETTYEWPPGGDKERHERRLRLRHELG